MSPEHIVQPARTCRSRWMEGRPAGGLGLTCSFFSSAHQSPAKTASPTHRKVHALAKITAALALTQAFQAASCCLRMQTVDSELLKSEATICTPVARSSQLVHAAFRDPVDPDSGACRFCSTPAFCHSAPEFAMSSPWPCRDSVAHAKIIATLCRASKGKCGFDGA